MELNYKRTKEGIDMRSFNSCEGFVVGDSIICMDDKKSVNITENRTYKALYIYEADCPRSDSQQMYVQIADDGNQICSYEVNRFKSIQTYRDDRISQIINN